MSILASIFSKILGHHGGAPASSSSGAAAASPSPASATTATPPIPTGPAATTPPAGGAPTVSVTADASAQRPSGTGATGGVDVAAVLDGLAAQSRERLDWKHSIVDMMKLLGLDSSLTARQTLAQELHYSGDLHDSASMNLWLHKQVMQKLAENGGRVPNDLRS